MSSNIITISSGITQVIQAPARSSVCFQPVAGGSATVNYSALPNGPFQGVTQSGNTSPFSFATDTYAANTALAMGNVGFVQVTAAGGQNCTVIVSDIGQYPGSFPERQTVAQSAVAYTMPNSTSELTLFSVRFPANYFKFNFLVEVEYLLTLTNNANAKTLKGYFGPSLNSATAGAIETASGNAIVSNAYTSMSGAKGGFTVAGRNDGQTIIGSNAGLLSAGGWGSSTTANVTVSSAAYQTSEQVMVLTGTKATGTDTVTLDAVWVRVIQ